MAEECGGCGILCAEDGHCDALGCPAGRVAWEIKQVREVIGGIARDAPNHRKDLERCRHSLSRLCSILERINDSLEGIDG